MEQPTYLCNYMEQPTPLIYVIIIWNNPPIYVIIWNNPLHLFM